MCEELPGEANVLSKSNQVLEGCWLEAGEMGEIEMTVLLACE